RIYRRELAACPPIDPGGVKVPAFRGRLIYACLGSVAVLLALLAADVPPPFAAILTASLLILAGSTRPRDAFKHIDWELLLMFAGLFVVMGGLRESGALEAGMRETARFAGASLFARVSAVSWVSAAVSNVVSNVPAVVFMVNLLPSLGEERALPLALAAASTVSGNFTIIGSVANLIVFESARDAKVGFWEYFKVGAPLSALLILLATLWLTLVA
ncbi:MAG: SLC13 family permease, partial [Elusimicrobiota bacterium]